MKNRYRVGAPHLLEGAVPMNLLGDGTTDFAALLRHHQTQLFGYIYSLVRDLDDADDLFQQTSCSFAVGHRFEQVRFLQELYQLGVWSGAI